MVFTRYFCVHNWLSRNGPIDRISFHAILCSNSLDIILPPIIFPSLRLTNHGKRPSPAKSPAGAQRLHARRQRARQHDHAAAAPLVLTASGPGGLEGGGGDSLTTSAAAPVTAPATAPAPAEPDGPAYSAPNAILAELSTSGASLESARQDDRNAMAGGPEVSARMAETDRRRVLAYLAAFVQVGEETGLPPALLAAIASRESRGGKHLDASGYGLSDPNGYGVMQVDKRFHKVASKEGVGGLTHIRQAAGVLQGMLEEVRKKMPDWTPAMQLRGAVAAYNFGLKSVQTWDGLDRGSAHHDYSADIWERARYYASLPDFGGDGTVVAAATQAAAAGRPPLRKGRLIAESVGEGGVNHEEDAARVLARLRALKVITEAEAADCSAAALAAYITRYQALVNDGEPDGLMEPGRKTEDRLIAGVLTRTAKPAKPKAAKPGVDKKQEKTPVGQEGKLLAEYEKVLRETPATEAGAEDILARGDAFAERAFADLARMKRFDLLAALKEEVFWTNRDWLSRSIASRLSDAELAALPKDFLAALRAALDAGITTAVEYALMDRLDKAAGGLKTQSVGSSNDRISIWLSKSVETTTPGGKNKENALLILEAVELGLATFSAEGVKSGLYMEGKGGVEDTFIKIANGDRIGNGKPYNGGEPYFYPDKTEIIVLSLLVEILKSKARSWVNNGRKGLPSSIMIGSFMIWNTDHGGGQLRNTNHGGKGRAIDFNLDQNQDGNSEGFDGGLSVDYVIDILSRIPIGTYEIGLPRQGDFIDPKLVSKGYTAKADDGSPTYEAIKSTKLREHIKSMLQAGYRLKVISDNPNHLHLAIGAGGKDYLSGDK
jgi:CRP-like cAMP-binding protein